MAMTPDEWLAAVKTGFGGIQPANTFHNELLKQKINAVLSYMTGAGVTETLLEDPLGVEVVTLGVRDLWNLTPGAVAFSSAFHVSLAQLKTRSLPEPTEV